MALLRQLRHARLLGLPQQASRLLHSKSLVLGFGSHNSDNDPDVLHKEKIKTLKGEHKATLKDHPGWNERLASDSEAAVKADKEEHYDDEHGEHIVKMQSHTVEVIKEVEKENGHASQENDPVKQGHPPR